MYIYEQAQWPQFSWDLEQFTKQLAQLRHCQGRLMGEMASIGFPFCDEALINTLTQDVVKSSEIEGEMLDQALVRSSVARHLGLERAALKPSDRHVDGGVEMVLDATQNFDQLLTKERLFNWHAALFPDGRSGFTKIKVGKWRQGVVQVVSGHMDRETLHFEAPPPERVNREMSLFLDWVNSETTMDSVLMSAVAHLWFVTIHPFEDGNGRIGRAIADWLLARSEKSARRFYSLSSAIQSERKGYYAILESTQKGELNITPWIEWFLGVLEKAIEEALSKLDQTLHKRKLWEYLEAFSLNHRQRKVINRLLDGFEGALTSSKWAKIAKCSQDTAYRDILDLIEKGVLKKNPGGGRKTSYSLMALEES